MATDTPPHRQWSHAGDAIHRRDIAVTRLAPDACQGMGLVTEPHEAWDGVHLDPGNRLALVVVPSQLRNFGMLRHDNAMTADALLHGWHPGKWRTTDAAMTQFAIQLIAGDVVAVVKINRLLRRVRRRRD